MSFFNKQLIVRLLPMFLVGFVIFAGAASSTSAQGIINEILSRMDAHNRSLTSLKANVTMVKENAQLGGALDTTEGTAIYLPQKGKSPLVRIDWVSPKESLAVVNKQYVIYRPALSQAYTGNTESQSKGNPNVAPALDFMNMSKAQLKQNYSIKYLGEATVKGGVKTWHLEMTPNARKNYKSAEVWVDGNGMPVQSKVIEHNNDSTTVLLSNLQKNIRINTADFKVDLPKGTKIIKS